MSNRLNFQGPKCFRSKRRGLKFPGIVNLLILIILSPAIAAEEDIASWSLNVKQDPFDDSVQVDASLEKSGLISPSIMLQCRHDQPYIYSVIMGANLEPRTKIRGKLRINSGEIREGDYIVLSKPNPLGMQIVFSPLSKKTFAMFRTAKSISIRINDKDNAIAWTYSFDAVDSETKLSKLYAACPMDKISDDNFTYIPGVK